MRRWLVPVVLALMAASSAAAALLAPGPENESETPTTPARLPVLSARRVPELISTLVADTRLRAELDAAMANPALGAGRAHSCLLVRQGGRAILDRRAHQRLIPASTLKVLTGHAVLAKLGEDEHLATEVRAARPIAPGGVVDGPLWLVGGGDPVLATADYVVAPPDQPQVRTSFEALADGLVAAGVRSVAGGVVGDETRYDVQRYLPTWKPSYITSGQVGPASALNLNDGLAQVAPVRAVAPQPDAFAAAALTNLLRARGVSVGGGPGEGKAPAESVTLARVASPPMRELVGQMLRDSDNLTAELLVKELGRRFADQGTTAAGVAVVRDALGSAGLPVGELQAVDGSGLDRSDRASCALLMAALRANGPSGALTAGFPVAARTGTLARRFLSNPGAGRLRAKTGSLDGVTGLTGFLDVAGGGEPLAFALLANDVPNDAVAQGLQEQIGAVLSRYPQGPPAADLAP